MSGHLLTRRLLNPNSPPATISLALRTTTAAAFTKSLHYRRPVHMNIPISFRAFPFPGIRLFSSIRRGRGDRDSGFSKDWRRDNVKDSRRTAAVGPKSLVQDEDEIDSWISGLKMEDLSERMVDNESDSEPDRRQRRGEPVPKRRASSGGRSVGMDWEKEPSGMRSGNEVKKKESREDLGFRATPGKSLNWEKEPAGMRLGNKRDSVEEVGFPTSRGRSTQSFESREFPSRSGRKRLLVSDSEEEIGGFGRGKSEFDTRKESKGSRFPERKASVEELGFRPSRGSSNRSLDNRKESRGGRCPERDSMEELGRRSSRGSSSRSLGTKDFSSRSGNTRLIDDDSEEEIGGFGGMKSNLDNRKGIMGGRFPERTMEFSGGIKGDSEDEDEDEDEDDEDDDDFGFLSKLKVEKVRNGLEDVKITTKSTNQDGDLQTNSSEEKKSYLSESRFDQCGLSPLLLKGVKSAGYEKMTIVQEATLPIILNGKDVLAKAKTGTGKTVAFLLPAIEAVAQLHAVDHGQRTSSINVLVVCPTRELANQAAAEASKLLKYHSKIGVQVVIGGTKLPQEQRRIQTNPCQILVATPGRLKDHIENTPGFAARLLGVKVLVLDEADHLLDMGFRKDIEHIISAVPKQRQTLLFSATVPNEVRQICHIALKKDHEFINTVEEGSEDTHSQVMQTHLVAPLDKHFATIYSILNEHISDDPEYKVLVFCTTAMVTRLVAQLLSTLNLNVREIHSRKSQTYRTKVSDEFRKSKGLILVTSDVSARGVDYPDVTLVVQVGLPSDREQYIHRLGRTGRKGKEGKGVLLLAPWEDFFLSTIRDLPITKASVPPLDPDMIRKVSRGLANVGASEKESAYQAWLGYYNSVRKISGDKVRLVQLANEFSSSMGLDTPPAISKQVVGKMGLKNTPGLRVK